MERSSLIDIYVDEVQRFCVENLAAVLYRCVEHTKQPRDLIDWFTAETQVYKHITSDELRTVTDYFLDLSVYHILKNEHPELPSIKWPWWEDITTKGPLGKDRLRQIDILEEKYTYLIENLQHSEKLSYLDRFLGRFVWNRFYQSLQSQYDFLEEKGYVCPPLFL